MAPASSIASAARRARHDGLAPHTVLRILRIEIERLDLSFSEAHGIIEVSACEDYRPTVQQPPMKLPWVVSALYQILIHRFGVASCARCFD
jgi:hypothetical protein